MHQHKIVVFLQWLSCGYRVAIEWLSSGYRAGVKQTVEMSVYDMSLGEGVRDDTSRAAGSDLVMGKTGTHSSRFRSIYSTSFPPTSSNVSANNICCKCDLTFRTMKTGRTLLHYVNMSLFFFNFQGSQILLKACSKPWRCELLGPWWRGCFRQVSWVGQAGDDES